jgi:outer membrane protein assembly factor BamB
MLPATAIGADWPQWRGPNRDGKAGAFDAPTTWPKELTKKWSVTVGDGVSTPALVGDRLYVFARQGGNEIVRCLQAADGKEVWQDKYPAEAPQGPARDFPGPRSSPVVADGKVVTFGVDSTFSCYEAASGKKLWRKDSLGDIPRFSTSCSPIVVGADGEKLVIVEYGGDDGGGIVAYGLADGKRKWVWNGDGAAYASPVSMKIEGSSAIVSETAGNIVALSPADGKLLWKTPFKVRYNAATPVVEGSTVLYSGSGKGTTAVSIEKSGDGLKANNLWTTNENAVQFNTPIIKDGYVYGISDRHNLFCMDAKTGKTQWKEQLKAGPRQTGYGSVVDAGSVLFALNPTGEMIVFAPDAKQFKKIANYQVGRDTYAYPVIADKRVFIKDKNDVALWSIE